MVVGAKGNSKQNQDVKFAARERIKLHEKTGGDSLEADRSVFPFPGRDRRQRKPTKNVLKEVI